MSKPTKLIPTYKMSLPNKKEKILDEHESYLSTICFPNMSSKFQPKLMNPCKTCLSKKWGNTRKLHGFCDKLKVNETLNFTPKADRSIMCRNIHMIIKEINYCIIFYQSHHRQ